MKIKRFVASDMRTAIRLVREEQGPNAVILSNRRVGDQIEVVAATDYDESLVYQALRQPGESVALTRSHSARVEASPSAMAEAPARAVAQDDRPRAERASAEPARAERSKADSARVVWAQDPHLAKLETQLGDLRRMIEGRLGDVENLAWASHSPQRNRAVMGLRGIGVDTELARSLAAKLPETDNMPVDSAALALRMFGRRLPMLAEESLALDAVVALVGPAGVGKTTTIAKLASRYAMRHGTAGLTLVTTDNFRIGAQEQLRTYGRLLGVPVIVAAQPEDLAAVVGARRPGQLVLIDTAGVGPRDAQLSAQWQGLAPLSAVTTLLCLPANAYRADLESIAARFAPARPRGCVLTKLDETAFLGAALSVALRQSLPIAYATDGQNVPADLHVARREDLIERAAAQLAQRLDAPATQGAQRACA